MRLVSGSTHRLDAEAKFTGNNLADDNAPGTLRHAINQEGPRVVVFEVSGTIRVDRWMDIANPYITIAGQTAPSPGIFLRGAVLNVGTHDVLIRHLRIAPGDDPKGVESENRDCLAIANPRAMPTQIVIDHCTFTWSVDESFSTWYPVAEITFRHLLVSEPLHNSIHLENGVLEAHGFGPLFYHNPESKITMTGNLISHCASRMPASGSGSLVMVNNFLYDKIDYMASLHNERVFTVKTASLAMCLPTGPLVLHGPENISRSNWVTILWRKRAYTLLIITHLIFQSTALGIWLSIHPNLRI